MRRMYSGLVAAMENEKVNNDDKKELPDHADSLETDVADINETAADGEAHQANIDQAEATAEALEQFRVALEGMQGDGGIDGKAAQLLHIGASFMVGNVGGSNPNTVVPAMESFGGTGSRLQAGTIALEEIKERIAEIWRAIVEAIKKAAAFVAGYWMKVFGAAEKLQRRAKELEERARQTTGQAKNKEIEDSGIASRVHMGAGGGGVAEGLTALKEVTSAIVTRGAATGGEVGKKAVEAVKALDGKNLPEILKLCEPIPGSKKIDNPQQAGVAAAPEGLAVYGTAELPGNFAVVSWVPAGDGGEFASQVKQLSAVAYKTVQVNKGAKADAKLSVMSLAECGSVAKQVGTIADELLAMRKNTSNLNAIQKELASAAEGVASKAGSEEDESKREQMSAVKAIATAANRLLVEPGASFSKYAIQACEAYLHWVEKSLKQYA